MLESIENRTVLETNYMIQNESTVRSTAKKFKISKSVVHKDLSERLWLIDKKLARKVRRVLDKNKAERHLRGGLATKRKYSSAK